MTTFSEVIFTLRHWLHAGRNDKAVKITIECENDTAFFDTYTQLRSEISIFQWAATQAPHQEILPVKRIDGQMQISFEMMGNSVTIKSRTIRVEPKRPYWYEPPYWPAN